MYGLLLEDEQGDYFVVPGFGSYDEADAWHDRLNLDDSPWIRRGTVYQLTRRQAEAELRKLRKAESK